MQFMVQGAWGVIPAHINELAPDSVRGFLPGFAYQCGVAVAGSVAYIEAVFAEHMTYATAMALTAVTVFTLGAIAAWAGRERHGVAFASSAASGRTAGETAIIQSDQSTHRRGQTSISRIPALLRRQPPFSLIGV